MTELQFYQIKDERDQLRQENAQLKAQLSGKGWRSAEDYDSEVKRIMEDERRIQARLINERDEAIAACAEMRELLGVIQLQILPGLDLPAKYIVWFHDALSANCGKGWRSAEEWNALLAELTPTIELLHGVCVALTALDRQIAIINTELTRLKALQEKGPSK